MAPLENPFLLVTMINILYLAYRPECRNSEEDILPDRDVYVLPCKDAEGYDYVLFHNAAFLINYLAPPVSDFR